MIRWATEADRWPLIELMQAAKMGCAWYTYERMDLGTILVDDRTGILLGYISFDLGHPETRIRQIVVAPEHQGHGLVAKRLLAALMKLAVAYGSQGLEGFQSAEHPELSEMAERAGGILQPGTRVRWPLVPGASETAERWKQALIHS